MWYESGYVLSGSAVIILRRRLKLFLVHLLLAPSGNVFNFSILYYYLICWFYFIFAQYTYMWLTLNSTSQLSCDIVGVGNYHMFFGYWLTLWQQTCSLAMRKKKKKKTILAYSSEHATLWHSSNFPRTLIIPYFKQLYFCQLTTPVSDTPFKSSFPASTNTDISAKVIFTHSGESHVE